MAAKRAPQPRQPDCLPARELLFGDLWEYDPAPETADPHIESRHALFIGGKLRPPKSGRYFSAISPRDESQLAEIPLAGEADVDAAYRAAAKALPAWRRMPGKERGKYLFRIARLLQDRAREFAVAETLDSGRPIRESRDFDVPLAAAHFFYHAGWADKLEYLAPGRTVEPWGVVGQVISWDFPLLMLAWKIAPALAAGNTVVLKPAATTSVTALKFATILLECGLPPGVVNLVTGPGATGAAVVRHPVAAKVAFTGCAAVGREIRRVLAGSGKPLVLALGGAGVNVVFEDAPLDQAVDGIVKSVFARQGQPGIAGSRVLVQESVAEAVRVKLKNRLRVLRTGDPLDKNTDVGALHSAEHLARVREWVVGGLAEGATVYQVPCRLPARGYYHAPTLVTGVSLSHRLVREETYGPVLSVMTFRTPDEAVAIANNSRCGASSAVWTDKGSRAMRASAALMTGVVWVNGCQRLDPAAPFGGCKESGFGRDGGLHGLREYVRVS